MVEVDQLSFVIWMLRIAISMWAVPLGRPNIMKMCRPTIICDLDSLYKNRCGTAALDITIS